MSLGKMGQFSQKTAIAVSCRLWENRGGHVSLGKMVEFSVFTKNGKSCQLQTLGKPGDTREPGNNILNVTICRYKRKPYYMEDLLPGGTRNNKDHADPDRFSLFVLRFGPCCLICVRCMNNTRCTKLVKAKILALALL